MRLLFLILLLTISIVVTAQDSSGVYGQITKLLNDKKFTESQQLLDKQPDSYKSTAEYLFLTGLVYDYQGMIKQAIKYYEKAIKMKSDYFEAYYSIAAVYYNQGAKAFEKDRKNSDYEKYFKDGYFGDADPPFRSY